MKVNWLPAVVPGRVTMTTQQPFFFWKSFTNFKGQKNKREYPTTFRNLIKQGNNHTMR